MRPDGFPPFDEGDICARCGQTVEWKHAAHGDQAPVRIHAWKCPCYRIRDDGSLELKAKAETPVNPDRRWFIRWHPIEHKALGRWIECTREEYLWEQTEGQSAGRTTTDGSEPDPMDHGFF